ncbi:HAMP domain-containing sensor histidine kinase [Bdellovibrionota bacterium FG-1]
MIFKGIESKSLGRLIFLRSLLIGLLVLIAFSLVSAHVIFKTINKSFEDNLKSSQLLFSETISQDILIGANAEVYRKCKTFFSNQPVLSMRITDSKGQPICDFGSEVIDGIVIKTPLFFDEKQKDIAAQVVIRYSTAISSETKSKSIGLLVAAIFFFALIQFLLARLIGISISRPITKLSEGLATGKIDTITSQVNEIRGSDVKEVQMLLSSIGVMASKIDEFQAQLIAATLQEALARTAAQVAHDIRSPLAALDNVLGGLQVLPEDDRILVRTAINRIKDIANNLIEKNREHRATSVTANAESSAVVTNEASSVQLLSSLIDPLISEKRMQFRSKIGVEIDGRLDASSYGLFARIQPTEFKRALSNLVNNAVEVLGDKGVVILSLVGNEGQVEIRITDNGKGIPPEVLAKLGQRGETHGKQGGSGLGLFHARTSVESWGGTLTLESEVGKGTTVLISLPQARAPSWFVSELKLELNTPVVVLDDDSSIHGIWQGRFDSLRVQEKGIEVLHFSTPDELIQWVNSSPSARSAVYLADYELLGHKQTGLDLIESLKIGPQSILVTSRFEEPHIRQSCERLRVRLIPKGLAGFVPISFAEPLERPDYVLIDDDSLVHMTWKYAAKKDGKNVRHFTAPDEFFAFAPRLHKNTPIYVDSMLGGGVKGEEIAIKMVNIGFTEIWLCTGLPPQNYKQMTYLKGCVSKDPPWFPDSHTW